MIELPDGVVPSDVRPALVDRGGTMRGASALRVNRLGSHFRATVTLPPLPMEPLGRVTVSRLIRGKREGIRIPYPLLGVNQGAATPGAINGAGQAGRTINLRSLTPGLIAREGFWLSIVDPTGQHYLHNVRADAAVGSDGRVATGIEPELRYPFPDGAAVHLGRPMIEGMVDGDEAEWSLSLANHAGVSFTIEEAR